MAYYAIECALCEQSIYPVEGYRFVKAQPFMFGNSETPNEALTEPAFAHGKCWTVMTELYRKRNEDNDEVPSCDCCKQPPKRTRFVEREHDSDLHLCFDCYAECDPPSLCRIT